MTNLRGSMSPIQNALWLRFLLMMVVLLACGNARAQTTGTLLGVVSDQNGAMIASATVRATNTDTGFTTSTKSSAEGSFLIPLLPIGNYTISVEASGFKKFSRSGVLVPVAQNIRVDVMLEIGEVAETIDVAGNAVNIETTNATLGATIDTARLYNLPLNGRNALGLLETLPGVNTVSAPTSVTWARSGPKFSISGSRTNAGNLMLDGTTFTDALSNTSQSLPSVDALQEFRVLSNSFSAEYGRAAGSVIIAVTKSGTNDFHGSLWEFLRNDAFDASNAFTPAGARKPFLRQNQFGGDLGGPVLLPGYNGRNRTFVFVAYEGLRIRQQVLTTAYPLTAAERNGDFSALLPSQVITDPNTGLPFPGNIIPGNRIDTFAKNVMNLYMPLPNQSIDNSVRLTQAVPTSGNQVTVKVDQTLGSSDRLWFRYYRTRNTSTSPQAFPAFQNPGVGSVKSFAFAETHTFTPNLINELQASYTRPEGVTGTEKLGKSARDLGMNINQAAPFPQVPSVSVAGDFSFGTDWYVDEPSEFRQFDEKISWLHGKHSIRAGVMIMRMRNGDLAYPAYPNVSFTGLYTGNAMADFLIGRPQSFSGLTTIHDDGTAGQYQPFIQDDYKISNRLTVNVGLRYDLETPWTELTGGASTFSLGKQSRIYPQAPPGLVVPGDPGVPRGFYRTFKTPFAPRVGFAWDPTGSGQTSIRAGWGIYHSVVNQEVEAVETNNEPFLVSFGFTPPNTANPWAGQTDPLPYDPAHPSFSYPMTLTSVDPNFRQGDTQQFNFNIQHRFWTNIFAQAAYVGSVSHHLYDARDLNAAVYGPGATEANAQSRRPIFPQFYGSIPGLFSDLNANYHSLQLEVQKRFANSYALQAAYTWGKSIDNRSTSLIGDGGAQDPNNWLRGERGLSDYDVSQILSLSGLWDLPALRGRGILTGIAGGWRLSGIVRYNGGRPLTVFSGADNALIGYSRPNSGRERANINGDPNLSVSRSRQALEAEYFNTLAFSAPAPGQFGTVGRNTIIGPGFLSNDLAISKTFPSFPREKGQFEFRAEFFNLINWTNLGQPNTTLTSPGFGQITNAGDPRIAQFALRYDF